jgi:DNA-binding MarR family transcriptional regulator
VALDLDRLGFLLARHGQIMNRKLRYALGVTGLGPRHAATLLRLVRLGPTSQQHLIDALAIDASALVAILNDLEGDGLVRRIRDPADRRRHIVEITKIGCKAAGEVEAAIGDVERETCAALDQDEIAQLQALLGRLRSDPDSGMC